MRTELQLDTDELKIMTINKINRLIKDIKVLSRDDIKKTLSEFKVFLERY